MRNFCERFLIQDKDTQKHFHVHIKQYPWKKIALEKGFRPTRDKFIDLVDPSCEYPCIHGKNMRAFFFAVVIVVVLKKKKGKICLSH